jgi:thymidylate synthase (FAD)
VQIVHASYDILNPKDREQGMEMVRTMELAARTCYKSEDRITDDGESAIKLITNIRNAGHHAMLEFGLCIVKFITDRGVTHELVRHRIASFAQESTRWCDYGGKGIIVVPPSEIWTDYQAGTEKGLKAFEIWSRAMEEDQRNYDELRDLGYKPQVARSVLPTCLKTEIVVGANTREWMHIFKMRTPLTVHPDMRVLMRPLLADFQERIPVLYDTIEIKDKAA